MKWDKERYHADPTYRRAWIQKVVDWKKKNPHKSYLQKKRYAERHYDRVLAVNRRVRQNLRLSVLQHYGGNPPKCACCGETMIAFLSLDHMKGGGTKEHRELHGNRGIYYKLKREAYPNGYQVLCMNCNWGRAYNDDICPHRAQSRIG